ncbi:MAG: hypothetical protein PVI98_12640 [Burkholderiales bacterium]|jgi:hypothetical protein
MRITAFIEYGLLGIGILGVVAGKLFGLPKGVELGIALVGLGFALAGLEAIISRQMSMRFSDYGWDDWMGSPSVIVGIMQLLVGLVTIGSAYALNFGLWTRLLNFLSERPGPLLAGIGLLLLGLGLVIIIVADRYGGKLRFVFVGLPRITFGVLIAVLGIAVVGAGAWEWFHHPSFERFAESAAQDLNLPPPGQVWRNTISSLR